ncbi:esterase [Sinobacterium caligoides]|uniref:Esterase n=1 Tax=Sinobacterium caligoides TaxID=933926 RepID=A0A3N2DY25_9GAMM|nr:alpha/beta fold hydrolase [Sinobacterium caligoides]ROS04770.1 esterase [Sinobacterium caligoides]
MLYYRELGQGAPVVLIHGLFGMGDNLLALAKSLAEQYRVILPDLAYHGRSPREGGVSHSEQAASVFATLDQLGIDSFRLLGHSLGGKVAMQMALLAPTRIESLIVVDIAPVHYLEHRHRNVFAALKAVPLDQISRRSDADRLMAVYVEDAGVRQFLLKNLYKDEEGGYNWRADIQALEQGYELIARGPDIEGSFQGPTLFIKGENSNYITRDAETMIRAYFPSFSFKMIAGVGHWLHAEKPALFNAMVARFWA